MRFFSEGLQDLFDTRPEKKNDSFFPCILHCILVTALCIPGPKRYPDPQNFTSTYISPLLLSGYLVLLLLVKSRVLSLNNNNNNNNNPSSFPFNHRKTYRHSRTSYPNRNFAFRVQEEKNVSSPPRHLEVLKILEWSGMGMTEISSLSLLIFLFGLGWNMPIFFFQRRESGTVRVRQDLEQLERLEHSEGRTGGRRVGGILGKHRRYFDTTS